MLTKKQFLDEVRALADNASANISDSAREFRNNGADLRDSVKLSREEPVNPDLIRDMETILGLARSPTEFKDSENK